MPDNYSLSSGYHQDKVLCVHYLNCIRDLSNYPTQISINYRFSLEKPRNTTKHSVSLENFYKFFKTDVDNVKSFLINVNYQIFDLENKKNTFPLNFFDSIKLKYFEHKVKNILYKTLKHYLFNEITIKDVQEKNSFIRLGADFCIAKNNNKNNTDTLVLMAMIDFNSKSLGAFLSSSSVINEKIKLSATLSLLHHKTHKVHKI